VSAGLVYEVNLDVEAGIRAEYLAWLDAHMAQIAALPGFTGARRYEVLDPPPPPGRLHLCAQYGLVDAAALEAYLRDHAPALRAEGLARFGGRFAASRRVLTRLA
jgi:hypothetical protein